MIVLKSEELDERVKYLIKTCIYGFHTDEHRFELFLRIFKALENNKGNHRLDLIIKNVIDSYRMEYIEDLKRTNVKDRPIQSYGIDC